MSVEIDPVELGFARPFTSEVSQILKIHNPNVTPVAFKVKTTAPKQYCVRPNSGRIEPGKQVEVVVLLQAMKQDPPLEAKCKDKFLVQSVAVTADKEFTNIGSIWQHIDDTDRASIQEKKIRVVFLPPNPAGSSAPAPAAVTPVKNGNLAVNGGHSRNNGTPDNSAPPAYSNRSPSPEETYTPQTRNTSASVRTSSVGPSIKSEDEPTRTPTPNAATSIKESISSATSAVSTAIPTTVEELKAQLAEAQAKIVALSQEGGLRMRKVAKGETSSPAVNEVATRLQAAEGVPVQIVAALCLLSFLLAYLFF